jgi:hypothetical protein
MPAAARTRAGNSANSTASDTHTQMAGPQPPPFAVRRPEFRLVINFFKTLSRLGPSEPFVLCQSALISINAASISAR